MPKESVHKKLERVRPPRVNITYERQGEIRDLPFVVGVLAPLSGNQEAGVRLKDRRFLQIDLDNFDTILGCINPRLSLIVDDKLTNCGTLRVDLSFRQMADFDPGKVARQIGPLQNMLEKRSQLADLRGRLQFHQRLEELLQGVLIETRLLARGPRRSGQLVEQPADSQIRDATVRVVGAGDLVDDKEFLDWIGRFVHDHWPSGQQEWRDDVAKEIRHQAVLLSRELAWADLVAGGLEAALDRRVSQLDSELSTQLNEIIHDKDFQRLEASWRGLQYLVLHTENSELLRIEVLDVAEEEFRHDLSRVPEFDQSTLFKKIYEERYDTSGGDPLGVLIGGFEFGRSEEDIATLEKIAGLAAAANCPFIAGTRPIMFGLESFTQLDQPRDLAKIFVTGEYTRWRTFRESQNASYVVLTLPRVLMRGPFGPETIGIEEFNYDEHVDAHALYLWGSAAFVLGARITSAFASYGWCAAIRGVESGGLVEDLPVHQFKTSAGDIAMKCPTETPITDRREKELADLGFVPLVHCKGTANASFFSVQSTQKPRKYQTEAATATARVAAQVPYVMATARFAHYMKVITRDRAGRYMSRGECERMLNEWISRYVAPHDAPASVNVAPASVKAKFPLREASVEVQEIPDKPGAYRAAVFLWPHFQLDELGCAMRMLVGLPLFP